MKLNLIKYKKVKSTNDEAIKIIRSRKNKQGIIVSNFQTKGKGTMGKKWVSLKGNIFASVFFELKKNMPNYKEFSLINPLIIKRILTKYTSFQVKIKWPNDLLIKSRKVCGILQELIKIDNKSFLIIGIGINTLKSPNNVKLKAISLMECSHKKINNREILSNLKKNYELSNWRYWKYKYKNL
tara:strand:- start:14062 stop:14610 length:549 start_codon:yes stop_codon:yes gene_type:complete